jgi:glycine/D-amino acid oxidase-like deaminating enzyme
MYLPLEAQANPQKATRTLAAAAMQNGAHLFTQHEVMAIQQRRDGSYIIETEQSMFEAGTLVLAAGAWCGHMGEALGLRIPILPVRGPMAGKLLRIPSISATGTPLWPRQTQPAV